MTKQESAALLASIVNLFLTATKFVLSSVTGSIALLAEAYHSLADVAASIMVFFAQRADRNSAESSTPQDLNKPNATEENDNNPGDTPRSGIWDIKAAIVIGILLAAVGVNILTQVVRWEPVTLNRPLLAACILAFLILCSYLVHRLETTVGRECGSQALIADGLHAKSDMLVSTLVFLILIGDPLGWKLDRPGAALIGILILIDAFRTLRTGFRDYFANRRGESPAGILRIEDTIASFVEAAYPRIRECFWRGVTQVPGLRGTTEAAQRRLRVVLLPALIFLALILYLRSGIYVVGVSEEAIIERFGKPLNIEEPLQPGIHYHLPWPIEQVRIEDTRQLRRMILGYRASSQSPDRQFLLWVNAHYAQEDHLLTGENSMIDVAANVHYRISDLFDYLYSSQEPDGILESIGQRALRKVLGEEEFFWSMTSGRDTLERDILSMMQTAADKRRLGIEVVSVCFRDMHPPITVARAFEDVVSAQEDKETLIEEARGYREETLPQARGQAATQISLAKAKKMELILMSEGEAASFVAQQEVYDRYPSLTQQRLLLETFEGALPPIEKYVVPHKKHGRKPVFMFRLPGTNEIPPIPAQPQYTHEEEAPWVENLSEQ